MRDDLGAPISLPGAPARVVSLVPSLTEALAPTGRLVGATDWCTHPASLDVERFRGTKNPDVRRIIAAAPDLVVANQEENRELDVRRLREAGVPVWVTRTETVPEALDALDRLFGEALSLDLPEWLVTARSLWDRPLPPVTGRVAIAVWRDPWMVVGGRTFAGDLARRLGWENAFDGPDRYPAVPLSDIDRSDVDLVLLPDEPYIFTESDGPSAFTQAPTRLVSGRLLTWYGPSLLDARALHGG